MPGPLSVRRTSITPPSACRRVDLAAGPAPRHRLVGVQDQVREELDQAEGVREHRRQALALAALDLDAAPLVAHQVEREVEDRPDVARIPRRRVSDWTKRSIWLSPRIWKKSAGLACECPGARGGRGEVAQRLLRSRRARGGCSAPACAGRAAGRPEAGQPARAAPAGSVRGGARQLNRRARQRALLAPDPRQQATSTSMIATASAPITD